MKQSRFFLLAVVLLPLSAFASLDMFQKAQQLERNHQLAQAIDVLKSGQSGQKPDDPAQALALLYSGILSFKLEKWADAQDFLTQALKKPLRLDDYAHYYLGLTRLKLGDFAGAQKELEWVKRMKGSAFFFDARYQLAHIAIEMKKWGVALAELQGLERKSRSNLRYPDVLWDLLVVSKRQNRKWQVCKVATQLYAKFPSYSNVQDWDVDLHNDKVDGETLGCTAGNKDIQSRIRRLQWSGQSERARKELDQLAKMMGRDPTFVVDKMLAQFLLSDGFVEDAMRVYLKHYDAQRNSLQYLMALGNAAARAGEMQAAIGAYYRAYKMSPRSKNGRQALFQAAFLSYRFQDYDGAGRKFEELIARFPRSGLSRDAQWHLAWMRYLKGDYHGAYANLNQLVVKKRRGRHDNSERDFSNEKLHYWMAMSSLKMGEIDKARDEFEALASDPLMGYYAIAARYRLSQLKRRSGGAKLPSTQTPDSSNVDEGPSDPTDDNESEETVVAGSDDQDSDDDETAVASDDEKIEITSFADPKLAQRFERVRDLRALGLEDSIRWELTEIEKRTRNSHYLSMLMQEYETSQVYNRSSYIGQTYFTADRAKLGVEGGRNLWESTYPRAYVKYVDLFARANSIPSELVWGIMRAESQYRPDVTSSVGALGLMQLMPFTARQVAGLLGVADFQTRQLIEPESNIKLGARYLRRLMDKFNRQIPLVAAGYNAGPHRVDEWLYSFGNLEMDEFIEHIPFVETRNYVKKVVRNFQIYKELYEKERTSLAYLVTPVGVKVTSPPSYRESWDTL